ncbi:uncharacterized protein MONOS_4420 [Monocercomonoides exilis]|uniref:uncharacterized protein n=1 Tax=Monocercomonoides exilis TaxID=2049356 RepID=UPI00355954C8|nr:hypothetical protein MONOS_4420 [Monocercomonoides exilis]|eukprot:MONOS_4420.1-p1 / transcript=MONOS_4420.1 / gene=MONOS_4420 / organism=Monocercomonoides_exilis_PA203 / gene_product=unspecified product / transcript_product=unspecified product / location=Mono_scaffold00117:90708-91507(-) / protein_length=239 / sequence_SO=supercontig / SO=protein_coding / is_pseudo=false
MQYCLRITPGSSTASTQAMAAALSSAASATAPSAQTTTAWVASEAHAPFRTQPTTASQTLRSSTAPSLSTPPEKVPLQPLSLLLLLPFTCPTSRSTFSSYGAFIFFCSYFFCASAHLRFLLHLVSLLPHICTPHFSILKLSPPQLFASPTTLTPPPTFTTTPFPLVSGPSIEMPPLVMLKINYSWHFSHSSEGRIIEIKDGTTPPPAVDNEEGVTSCTLAPSPDPDPAPSLSTLTNSS